MEQQWLLVMPPCPRPASEHNTVSSKEPQLCCTALAVIHTGRTSCMENKCALNRLRNIALAPMSEAICSVCRLNTGKQAITCLHELQTLGEDSSRMSPVACPKHTLVLMQKNLLNPEELPDDTSGPNAHQVAEDVQWSIGHIGGHQGPTGLLVHFPSM